MRVNALQLATGEVRQALQAAVEVQQSGAFRSGYILHGPPGCGKTGVVAELAEALGIPLVTWRAGMATSKILGAEGGIFLLDALDEMKTGELRRLFVKREIGEEVLPDSALLIGIAPNTVDQGLIADLGDQAVQIVIAPRADDWITNFAVPNGLEPSVIAFVRCHPGFLDNSEEIAEQCELIAASPRGWERVSEVMRSVNDRQLRDVVIAGFVGDMVAAKFADVSDEVAAATRVETLLAAKGSARAPLYPKSEAGLIALIFALTNILNDQTAHDVISIMADVRNLNRLTATDEYASLPLDRLCGEGFDMLLRKGQDLGLKGAFLDHPAYARFASDQRLRAAS